MKLPVTTAPIDLLRTPTTVGYTSERRDGTIAVLVNRRNDALVIMIVLAIESAFELAVFNKSIFDLRSHQVLLGGLTYAAMHIVEGWSTFDSPRNAALSLIWPTGDASRNLSGGSARSPKP